MQRLFSILLICLCLAQSQQFSPTFTSPVFMWSNMQYFGGKNIHVGEYTSVDDLAKALSLKESPVSKYFSKSIPNPEAIFVFIEPELRTEQFPMLANAYTEHPNGGAFSKMKGTLESYATSSLVIPFTHVGEQKFIGSAIVLDLVQKLPKEATITIAAADLQLLGVLNQKTYSHVSRLSFDELKSVANKDWSIFSNGVTDIVIICFDSPAVHVDNVDKVIPNYAADDSFMNEILQNVGGSYLAIFTSDKPANDGVKLARATMMVRQLTDDTGIYPADVVEAHIVMIPFLFILFLGICCTCGVQSDLKFDAEKKTFKK